MGFAFVWSRYHAEIYSVSGVTKSSHTLYGWPSIICRVYSTCGIPSRSMILLAITSLYGSCRFAPLPPFTRHRFPSKITHFFRSHPSEVLSGDIRSGFSLAAPPNSVSPTSPEKGFSKKLTAFQHRPLSFGQIQYWSDRLRPRHFSRSLCGVAMFSSSNTWRSPARLAGMARPIHHSLRAARSAIPFRTLTPRGRCAALDTSYTAVINPVASSNSTPATATSLCIKTYFLNASGI